MNGINNCCIHPSLDDESHPVMDSINNCYIHPAVDGQCRTDQLWEVNACHPKVDCQFHPFLDDY